MTYTATLYRQDSGAAAWKIISPAGATVQDGIESDHDLEAILAEWNAGLPAPLCGEIFADPTGTACRCTRNAGHDPGHFDHAAAGTERRA